MSPDPSMHLRRPQQFSDTVGDMFDDQRHSVPFPLKLLRKYARPGELLSCDITFSTSVPSDLLADRGDGSIKASGDGAQCVTGGNTSGSLFTLA